MKLLSSLDKAFGYDTWLPMYSMQTALISPLHGAFITHEPLDLGHAFPDCVVHDFAQRISYESGQVLTCHDHDLTPNEQGKLTDFSLIMRYMIALAAFQLDGMASTLPVIAGVHLGNQHADLHTLDRTIYDAFAQTSMLARRLEGISGRQAGRAAIAVKSSSGGGYATLQRKKPLVIRTPPFPVGMIPPSLKHCLSPRFTWH